MHENTIVVWHSPALFAIQRGFPTASCSMRDLSDWKGCPAPEIEAMDGRFVRLERLSAARHGDGLYACSTMPDADARFRWLPEYPPENSEAFQAWLDKAEASTDPLYYAVIDKASGRSPAGRPSCASIPPTASSRSVTSSGRR
jgi:hypothetical protein